MISKKRVEAPVRHGSKNDPKKITQRFTLEKVKGQSPRTIVDRVKGKEKTVSVYESFKCPKCLRSVNEFWNFCAMCGYPLQKLSLAQAEIMLAETKALYYKLRFQPKTAKEAKTRDRNVKALIKSKTFVQ